MTRCGAVEELLLHNHTLREAQINASTCRVGEHYLLWMQPGEWSPAAVTTLVAGIDVSRANAKFVDGVLQRNSSLLRCCISGANCCG